MKLFKRIIFIFIVAMSFIGLVSCDDKTGDPVCIHNFTIDVTYATCTEPGKVVKTCTKCGYVKEEKTPETGHNYVAGICTDCGDRQ